jgi:hypothetical protein
LIHSQGYEDCIKIGRREIRCKGGNWSSPLEQDKIAASCEDVNKTVNLRVAWKQGVASLGN